MAEAHYQPWDWSLWLDIGPVHCQYGAYCWIFPLSEVVRCAYLLSRDMPGDYIFSLQHMLDCFPNLSKDCSTSINNAFTSARDIGLVLDRHYLRRLSDHKEGQMMRCLCRNIGVRYRIRDFERIDDDARMVEAVRLQPLFGHLRASEQLRSWLDRDDVFISRQNPDNNDPRHAVLIVGANREYVNGVLVWYLRIKNSWGPRFGRNGYAKICLSTSHPDGIKVITAACRPIIDVEGLY